MPGPKRPDEALRWIREAVSAGRFIPSRHFRLDRLEQRGLSMDDVYTAIGKANEISPYTKREPVNGGTCWRVCGPSLEDDRSLAVGVEAFLDRARHRATLCTVFVVTDGGSHEV